MSPRSTSWGAPTELSPQKPEAPPILTCLLMVALPGSCGWSFRLDARGPYDAAPCLRLGRLKAGQFFRRAGHGLHAGVRLESLGLGHVRHLDEYLVQTLGHG